eukprot:TRINITY_DN43156_c0_g1_i1.p1 TRINITY_DN43156_c0_g1~~TRINITY_DN43156_c0_g1_i1.p1  ORF type:complete len:495 (+),score=59.35 TRINITY_DN43156_c0_g1_i1:94-1485(+)
MRVPHATLALLVMALRSFAASGPYYESNFEDAACSQPGDWLYMYTELDVGQQARCYHRLLHGKNDGSMLISCKSATQVKVADYFPDQSCKGSPKAVYPFPLSYYTQSSCEKWYDGKFWQLSPTLTWILSCQGVVPNTSAAVASAAVEGPVKELSSTSEPALLVKGEQEDVKSDSEMQPALVAALISVPCGTVCIACLLLFWCIRRARVKSRNAADSHMNARETVPGEMSAAEAKAYHNRRSVISLKARQGVEAICSDGSVEACDFFLSHYQATGGDQANTLCLELERMGYRVWYDNNMPDLTTEGMKRGVQNSANFILFLSQGVMARPFVQLETREALVCDTNFILVHETDLRHGAFDFAKEQDGIPREMLPLLHSIESIPWQRRDFLRHATLDEIVKRSKAGRQKPSNFSQLRKQQSQAAEEFATAKNATAASLPSIHSVVSQADASGSNRPTVLGITRVSL